VDFYDNYVAGFCISAHLLLCHSLIRSVLYSTVYFTQRR